MNRAQHINDLREKFENLSLAARTLALTGVAHDGQKLVEVVKKAYSDYMQAETQYMGELGFEVEYSSDTLKGKAFCGVPASDAGKKADPIKISLCGSEVIRSLKEDLIAEVGVVINAIHETLVDEINSSIEAVLKKRIGKEALFKNVSGGES